MKPLIVYYSFTGNNQKLANHLAQQIDCELLMIEPAGNRNGFSIFLDIIFNRTPSIKPISMELGNYDQLIFISPIWAGKIAMPLKTFLLKEAANIKHYSFITICGGGNDNQKNKLLQQLIGVVGHKPDRITELWLKNIPAQANKAVQHDRLKINEADIHFFKKEMDAFVLEIVNDSCKHQTLNQVYYQHNRNRIKVFFVIQV